MNVTLIYPCVKNGEAWNSLGTGFDSMFVNHGLSSLAAVLQKHGHAVKVLDFREHKGWLSVEQAIRDDDAAVYGIHIPTLDYHFAVKTAQLIKQLKPTAYVVAGGPHASICPEQVANTGLFDHVFVGEGEVTFPLFVADRVAFRQTYQDKIVVCDRPELDRLPYENREVFNMKKILSTNAGFSGSKTFQQPFINVISGRGCVFRCGFCKPGEDKIFGAFRMRSLPHFMGEIKALHVQYQFKTLMIDDDSFTLSPKYLKEFCEVYRRDIGESFICQSRADFICKNPDLVKLLKDTGLMMFFIGFESGSQRMLDFMHKDVTVEQNFRAAEICRQNDLKIWANFMVGLPTETRQEMNATFNMVRKIKPDHPSGAFFTPIVGTALYDYCKNHDLLITEDPSILGSRNPTVPKIKGVDYAWMNREMSQLTSPRWKLLVKPIYRKSRRVTRKVLNCLNPKHFEVSY